jgi:hypothetical protein
MRDFFEHHPNRALAEKAQAELEICSRSDAMVLLGNILEAVEAYVDFLHHHNLIWEVPPKAGGMPRLKAQALVVTADFREDPEGASVAIELKGGPLDRMGRELLQSQSARAGHEAGHRQEAQCQKR